MRSPDSFDEYVAARYAALTRTAYLLTGNHHDAEDLVQSALVKAVAVWKRIQERPDAYVRRIMVNENVSRWRRHRGREVVVERVPDRAAAPAHDDTLHLQEALARLAPRQRAVIVLRYYEDLTEQQTAEVLGIAVGTVKSQARDALARLRAAGLDDPAAGPAGTGESASRTAHRVPLARVPPVRWHDDGPIQGEAQHAEHDDRRPHRQP